MSFKKICFVTTLLFFKLIVLSQLNSNDIEYLANQKRERELNKQKVLNNLAKISNSNVVSSISILKENIDIIEKAKFDEKTKDTLMHKSNMYLGFFYMQLGKPDSVVYHSKIARDIAIKFKSSLQQLYLNTFLSKGYLFLDQIDSSFLYIKYSENLFEIDSLQINSEPYIQFLLYKGDVMLGVNNYEQALQQYIMADSIAHLISSYKMPISSAIAHVYYETEDYDKALDNYKKALGKLSDKAAIDQSIIFKKIGNIYAFQSNKDSCLYYYEKAINIHKQNKTGDIMLNSLYVHIVYNYFINYYEHKISINYLEDIKQLPPKNKKFKQYIPLIDTIYLDNIDRAKFFFCSAMVADKIDESIIYATKAISSTSELDFEFNKTAYSFLYKQYKKIGNKEMAFTFLEKAKSFQDSIDLKDKKLAVQRAIVENVLNKKDQEIITKEVNFNKKDRSKKQTIITLIIILLILFVLSIILHKRYKNKKGEHVFLQKEKTKLEKTNTTIQKNLVDVSLELEKDKQFIEKTKIQVKEIRKKSSGNQNIDELYVNMSLHANNQNPELEDKIKLINESFFNALDKKAKLTKTEKKLSGLLKLDLTSKEIATLLNISERSVETYRYNIRKKLNIPRDTSLHLFFKNM